MIIGDPAPGEIPAGGPLERLAFQLGDLLIRRFYLTQDEWQSLPSSDPKIQSYYYQARRVGYGLLIAGVGYVLLAHLLRRKT